MFRRRGVQIRVALLALCLSIFPPSGQAAENLGTLGTHPRWSVLEKYQETITHDDFTRLVQDVYCTHGFGDESIKIDNESARILTNRDAQSVFTLRFAKDESSRKPVPRLWRPAKSLSRTKDRKSTRLNSSYVAISYAVF